MNSERAAQLQVALASYDLKELRVQKRYLQEQGTAIGCTCFCSGEKLLAQLRQTIGEDGAILQTDVSARRQGAYLMVTLRAECEEQIGVDAPLAITSDTGR